MRSELSKAEVSLMLRKWDGAIRETKAQMKKKYGKDNWSRVWEQMFHETRIRRFVERHANGNEILEKNLLYLTVYTRLKKPNIRDVSLDLLSLDEQGNSKCILCQSQPIVGYVWEPLPGNNEGRDIAFMFWCCNSCESKLQEKNVLITQKVEELYSKNNY